MDHREDYKGAVNTLTARSMPAPQRENMQRLVNSWLEQVTADIGEGRKMAAADVQRPGRSRPVPGRRGA